MKTLAIEMSTNTGSIALLVGHDVVCERVWDESRAERQGLFAELGQLCATGVLELADVDLFAVGVGPGAFAGLRMAMAAACSLAAPGAKRVVGIGSSEAAAYECLNRSKTDEVVVFGDARRQELWAHKFRRGRIWPELQAPMFVGNPDGGSAFCGSGLTAWITADWDRIGSRLESICPAEVVLERRRVVPSARSIGLLGLAKLDHGSATEPLVPVYVHPATTVAPRDRE